MYTELKNAKRNIFKKIFTKLIKNAVFGKANENVRKHRAKKFKRKYFQKDFYQANKQYSFWKNQRNCEKT